MSELKERKQELEEKFIVEYLDQIDTVLKKANIKGLSIREALIAGTQIKFNYHLRQQDREEWQKAE